MIILKKKIKYIKSPRSFPGKKVITYCLFFIPLLKIIVELEKGEEIEGLSLIDSPRF